MDVKKPGQVHLNEIKDAVTNNELEIHMKVYNYLVRVNRARALGNVSKVYVNLIKSII